MAWIIGLNASPALYGTATAVEMVADTTIEASICAGESYDFDGELLDAPGEYTAVYQLPDGSDSTVTLILSVLPTSFTEVEESICEGESYDFNGTELTEAGVYTATLTAENGCDSIVTLFLSLIPPVKTDLNASICEGESYDFQGEELSESGVYSIVLTASNGCDSIVTLFLSVVPPAKTELSATICEGTTYDFQGEELTESGVYSIVLTTTIGCDSIVTLNLSVVEFFETAISATICDGETYEFGGADLSASGVYSETLTAEGGCDSIITLTLTVLDPIVTNLSLSLCEGSSYDFNGETLTVAGIYEAILTAENGCDSTVVLDLNFVTSFETFVEATICANETYSFGDDELDQEGEYVVTFNAQGDCDSTVTLRLTVLPVSNTTDQATICAEGSFEYNGSVLTDEGEYTFVLTGENGCDSTVLFTLTVLPAIGTSFDVDICEGDSYEFSGEILTDAGVYEAILTAYNGCDSVVILTLGVLPLSHTDLSVAICEGESYDYNGESYSDAGTYEFVFEAYNGCDSTVTLVLTVNPPQSTTVEASICEGDAYEFDGTLISEAGEYIAIFSDENGCDSTVTLILTVLPVQNTSIEATICDNQTYDFNGESLTDEGTYTAVLTGENGCDSTVVLTLRVLPTQNTSIEATICEGDAYDYFGQLFTDAGDYEFGFEGENGCDSTVVLSLTVLPVPQTLIEVSVCEGETYEYNGETLSGAGDYPFVFDAFNGCDSIVTIRLIELPLTFAIIEVSQCIGTSYEFNGDILTDSGVYTAVTTGANGCDSTTTLVLEFVSSFFTFLDVSICAGESYDFGGETLTESGSYELLLTAVGDCDSLVSLTLTVLDPNGSTIDVSICAGETYLFDGLELADAGTYEAIFSDANGCDSLAILNLSVLPLQGSSVSASICAGDSYEFNGETYSDAGTYTAVLTGENGCDSIVVLSLSVLPTQSSDISATICANETYEFNGEILSDAGTYTAVLTGENGCDSTVVLSLSVLPTQSSDISATICANESYDFNGESLGTAGTYTAVLTGENGCDSLVTLQLSVLPLAQSSFAASVCDGASFEYNGTVFTESGQYEFVYAGAAANGCDSLETLFLTIFPAIPPTLISATICNGEIYDFNGSLLFSAGTYTANLVSSVGCDSIVILTLTVNETPTTNLTASICAGESYPFNGQLLTTAGTYTAVLVTYLGCDSTVILNLVVNTVDTGVSVQGNTISASATGASYQWINCDTGETIAGATGSTFTANASGNYAVVVTQNGCTATSTCVFVQGVSTKEPIAQSAWGLQPNPASERTQLVFMDDTTEDFWLEIHDMAGRTVYSQNVVAGTRQITLDLGTLPDGILVVRLATKHGVSAKRLMKAAR